MLAPVSSRDERISRANSLSDDWKCGDTLKPRGVAGWLWSDVDEWVTVMRVILTDGVGRDERHRMGQRRLKELFSKDTMASRLTMLRSSDCILEVAYWTLRWQLDSGWGEQFGSVMCRPNGRMLAASYT